MAKKGAQDQTDERLTVERLKEINRTSDAAYQGMCAANGWRPGRLVSPEEYWGAYRRFLGAAIGGR